jgi:hypothetical protein
MIITPRQARLLEAALTHWQAQKLIQPDQVEPLRASWAVRRFDWRRLALVSFSIAGVASLAALLAFVRNDLFRRLSAWLTQVYELPLLLWGGIFATLAVVTLGGGRWWQQRHPVRMLTGQALLFLGLLWIGAALGCIQQALVPVGHPFQALYGPLLAGGLLYLALAAWWQEILPLALGWLALLLGLMLLFGGPYWLGLNYPLRLMLFSALLAGGAFLWQQRTPSPLGHMSYLMGLVVFFISWWLLAIGGNSPDLAYWAEQPQPRFLGWGLVALLLSGAAIWLGWRCGDDLLRNLGVIFALINLYTKYIEYGWSHLNRPLFFLILALSFYGTGRLAERLGGPAQPSEPDLRALEEE